MRYLSLLVFLAAPVSVASAAETASSTDVDFTIGAELFRGNELEFRFPDDPDAVLSIRVIGNVDGQLDALFAGESELFWPDAITQTWYDVAEGGFAELTTKLDARLRLGANISIGGFTIPELTYDLYTITETWSGFKGLKGLLLPGGLEPQAFIQIDPSNFYSFSTNPFVMWENDGYEATIKFGGSVDPDAQVSLTGTNIRTNPAIFTHISDEHLIPVPSTNDGTAEFQSVWTGLAKSTFKLNFSPIIEVSYRGFNVGINNAGTGVSYSFPWTLASTERDLVSKATAYKHDLPAIQLSRNALDLGTVTVGESATAELEIRDLGLIDLWGTVKVAGEGFSIDGSNISADDANPDKVVVTFAPTEPGGFTGTLTFETNDPVRPTVEVPLSGKGASLDGDTGGTGLDDTGHMGAAQGCGCQTSPAPASFGFLALGLAAVLGRRRR